MSKETTFGFKGRYYFLSNMYPCDIYYQGIHFKSSEHLYQWLKIDDGPKGQWWKNKILESDHGKVAKKLVANPKCPKKNVDDWDTFRLECMTIAIHEKFKIPELQKMLIDSYPVEIIEYNKWNDEFFGVCNGKGKNHLGELLMILRSLYIDK